MSLRACSIHGLWERTTEQRACPKCSAQTNKRYDNNHRNKESSDFYHGTQWKAVRDRHLRRNPLCVVCGRPAKIVDHIKEISDGGCRLCDDNLQSLCVADHNTKTAKERKGRG